MDSQHVVSLIEQSISHNYAPRHVVMDHGEGVELVDMDGRRYLDFVSGIAVCSLGYAHPELTAALQDQVAKLLHASNMFISEPQAQLQAWLTERSFADRVYLCNSGTEANEAAIKLARRYQKKVAQAPERINIISALKSFHGRTYASLAATGQPKYWDGFEPMPAGFVHVPYNDLEAMRSAIDENTCAVLLEPVQGEGGIAAADRAYLEGVRALCDEAGALLIFDEVQCGVGRIGTLWAYEYFGVTPDVVTWAKGIGGGVPLGVMASNERASKGFAYGSHASTFGGNPLAARAGLTVLQTIDAPSFLENVRERGEQLRAGLEAIAERQPMIREVRGVGLMIGVEVGAENAKAMITAAREEGLLINSAGGHTLRFVPPLIITAAHVEDALARFERAFARISA